MGQEESTVRHKQFELPARGGRKAGAITAQHFEHQGLLKLREIPFRNSIEISHQPPLFLESADATLAELLYSRYNTTKLFTEEDIFKLAESVLYTLSFLQSKKVSYVDLCQENIYYDAQTSSFKLLPIELIKDSAYELAKSGKRFSLLAPELVLALRYGESEIEEDIQDRSNVFTLGMILLEALTLLPSKDCYDGDSYDILDEMVTSRLDTVREFYPEFLAKLIQRMLQYDYAERADIRQLSIEMNREITESRVMARPTIKAPQLTNQGPAVNPNMQYRPNNLGKSQLKYQPQIKQDPTQGYGVPSAQIRPLTSNQFPTTQGLSPSRLQPVDRHYSQPQNQYFDPQQSNVSTFSYVSQHQQQPQQVPYIPPLPAYGQSSYPQTQQTYGYQQHPNPYRQVLDEAETPRYNALEENEEISEEAPNYYYQENLLRQQPRQSQQQQTSFGNRQNYQNFPKQVYTPPQQQYPPTVQQFEPFRQQPPQTSSNTFNQWAEEQGYHSPIDETREPKRNITPSKRGSNPHLSKPGVISNYQPENYTQQGGNQRQQAHHNALKDNNHQPLAPPVDKSPAKRRLEYISPLQEEDITDNSITRLKEEIEKSRRLIMEFQRMEGLTEPDSKNKKFLPA